MKVHIKPVARLEHFQRPASKSIRHQTRRVIRNHNTEHSRPRVSRKPTITEDGNLVTHDLSIGNLEKAVSQNDRSTMTIKTQVRILERKSTPAKTQ